MNRYGRHNHEKLYSESLSNYETVLKDTGGRIVKYPTGAYNCMGYAFGIYDWLDINSFIDTDGETIEEVALDCAIEIEERFNCRRITSPEVATKDERVIAMRIGEDDFHFARLNSDGTWTHKPGSWSIREMTEEELYSNAWMEERCCPYISTVYFFAIKIK